MRVLLINNFHYLRGGADKVYLDTGKLLEQNGHQVAYFSSLDNRNERTQYAEFFVEGTDLQAETGYLNKAQKALRFIYNPSAADQLDRLINHFRPDVVHLHIFQSRLTSAILPVLRRYKLPVVMTVHEYKLLCPVYSMMDTQGKSCELCSQRNKMYSIVKRCNRNSLLLSSVSFLEATLRDTFFFYEDYVDRFLCVSDFVVNKHLEYRNRMKGKIFRLYNFLDLSKYGPDSVKSDYFIYVGRLSHEKGVQFLLEAWKYLQNFRLFIVGDGPDKALLINFIKENNLTNVSLLGYQTPDKLIPLIQHARYLVSPSLTYETFGLTLIEAMACGTPPIAARIGGMKELITHSENGFLFDSGNQHDFISVIQHANQLSDEDYNRIISSGMAHVNENFGANYHYHQLMAHYEAVSISKRNFFR